MPALLLRVAKRRTAWESVADLDLLLKTEFRTKDGSPDLTVSVYEIDRGDVLRAIVEHSAGVGLAPPRGGLGIDMASDRTTVTTPGETHFAFTEAAHRELRFIDETDLRLFLEQTIVPTLSGRTLIVTKQQIKDFVKWRRDENDLEWMAFLQDHPRWG